MLLVLVARLGGRAENRSSPLADSSVGKVCNLFRTSSLWGRRPPDARVGGLFDRRSLLALALRLLQGRVACQVGARRSNPPGRGQLPFNFEGCVNSCCGLLPGQVMDSEDVEQACVFSSMRGTPTWLRMPRETCSYCYAEKSPLCAGQFAL